MIFTTTLNMRFALFFLLSHLTFIQAFAQNEYKEFGDVTMEDFRTKSNSDADAIVIFDKGDVVIEPSAVIGTTFTRHVRIKILTKDAFSRGNFEYIRERGAFRKPRGVTYNLENGMIVTTDLKETSILQTRHNKYYDKINVAFPNIKEGSIIEFSYTLKYENLYFPTWQFQNTIPVLWSQYTLNAHIKDHVSHLRGQLKPTKYEEKYESKRRSWTMINVPAFKSEPLMPDKEVYLSSVEFGLRTKTWEEVRNSLLKNERFAGIVFKHNFIKKKVNELINGVSDSLEMVKIISNHIKKEITFNGYDDFLSDDPSEVINRKSGSVGDNNLLLASMLNKAGFKVSLILLSTTENGFVLDSFPSSTQFNYVVCYIKLDNKEYFLDATEKLLPFNVLPERCFNHKGFLISTKEYGWIPMEPIQKDKVYIEANLALNGVGNLSGTVTISRYDYAAFRARKENTEAKQSEFKKELIGSAHATLTKSETLNLDEIDKPLIESYKILVEQYADVSPDLMYIKPHLFFHSEYNPFTADNREYPIDFPDLKDTYITINLAIPEGYQIDELPQSKVLTLPENAAKYSTGIKTNENRIIITSRTQINQKLFQPHDYLNLKEFYTRMIAKKSELITLKRK